ncbi:Re/Si-specific NAD(P)(+) transhydrogenase subunit alpha [Candidatus Magnetaquicoccus inordinatus]|uniref:Re/Si-specific NAD(P)(+) transhydrogenase subunit alpha n=1 Tax=Candidatus Magnetaquicoccus inordinatus TaxID=2496818 RepID=UPI00102C523F|nr:Re/Si-specific NAD(P)(+) transhydrogenase subunit alpha [Candidatus Magnetaquicoccus inordinatus]
MKIGIPREIYPEEKRVAASPDSVKQLIKMGYQVIVENNAGAAAQFTNDSYTAAGAEIAPDADSLWGGSDMVIKVRPPMVNPADNRHEADLLSEGKHLISFIWPAQNKELMDRLAARKVTVLAMDSVPRISRAQKLDALSSMANIAGYRAVLEAAHHFGRFFTGQITAAGRVPPAKIMVIGAGVAGLSAIGTAVGMGAVVRAFDTRPEVADQVKSMGAEFLMLNFEEDGTGEGGYAKVMSPEFIKAEMELFAQQAKEVDIIITTALIPGVRAPILITEEMVKSMKQGSVVVDLASEQGGNCEGIEPGKVVVKHGVTLIGYTDLPSRLATQASNLYAQNICHLLKDMTKDGVFSINMEDVVQRGTTVISQGEVIWPPPKLPPPPVQAKKPAAPPPTAHGHGKHGHAGPPEDPAETNRRILTYMGLGGLVLALVGMSAPPAFLAHLTVFALSCFIGYMVVWNVTPALHTPLMSVTNAISGIIVIGAMVQMVAPSGTVVALAAIAALLAAINIAGGFLVTQRMLKMFRKE